MKILIKQSWLLVVLLSALQLNQLQSFGMDNLNAIFEDLFGLNDDLDEDERPPSNNIFSNLFKEPAAKKPAPAAPKNESQKATQNPTIIRPTAEQLAAFDRQLDALLTPLGSLIREIHFNHIILGGSLYERTKQARSKLTNLESALLNVGALKHLLNAQQIKTFTDLLAKQSVSIGKMAQDIMQKAATNTPKDIDAEDAFILGDTHQSPYAQNLKKHQTHATSRLKKLTATTDPLYEALQKQLTSDELKKYLLQLTQPNTGSYKPTPSITSRVVKDASKSRSSSSHGSPYEKGTPSWSGNYSSGSASSSAPTDNQASLSKASTAPQTNQGNGYYPPPAAPSRTPEPSGPLTDLVKQLANHPTVILLLKMLEEKSYIKTFVQLFAKSEDGALTGVTQLLKAIEAAKKQPDTPPHKKSESPLQTKGFTKKTGAQQSAPETKNLEQLANEEEERAQRAEDRRIALDNYDDLKNKIISALLKLYYTPVPLVLARNKTKESSKGPVVIPVLPDPEGTLHFPKKNYAHPIVVPHLAPHSKMCRHAKIYIESFLNMCEKELGYKHFINKEQHKLFRETDGFEKQRSLEIKKIIAQLGTKSVTVQNLKETQKKLNELVAFAYKVRFAEPTFKSSEHYFYHVSKLTEYLKRHKKLSPKELEILTTGEGTVRATLNKALDSLSSKLEVFADTPEAPQPKIKALRNALAKVKAAWVPTLATVNQAPQSEQAATPIPNPALQFAPPAPETPAPADQPATQAAPQVQLPPQMGLPPIDPEILKQINPEEIQRIIDMLGNSAQK